MRRLPLSSFFVFVLFCSIDWEDSTLCTDRTVMVSFTLAAASWLCGNPWQCDFNLKSQIIMPGTQTATTLKESCAVTQDVVLSHNGIFRVYVTAHHALPVWKVKGQFWTMANIDTPCNFPVLDTYHQKLADILVFILFIYYWRIYRMIVPSTVIMFPAFRHLKGSTILKVIDFLLKIFTQIAVGPW